MNFELNEDQKMIKETLGSFCKKEVSPLVRKIDEEKKIPDDLIRKLAEIGLLGLTVSREYGGTEADPVTVGLIAEELAAADLSCAIPTFFLVQAAWGHVLNKYGREEVKKEILPAVVSGRAFLGIAATEPDAGSDLAGMRTSARKAGDLYILNGEKMFISGIAEILQQMPEGGGYVTLVKTDSAMGTRGMSLFYLPVKDAEGVSFTFLEDWGRRGISTGGFKLDETPVPSRCAEAKMPAPAFAFEAINDAIQWFGAFGYTVECPLELALKGVRSYFWAEGSLEIMKIITARELLGKDFVAYR